MLRQNLKPRDVVQLAVDAARDEGWALMSPVRLSSNRRWLGGVEWLVRGRGPTREHHSWVRIDDRTGAILATGWRRAHV